MQKQMTIFDIFDDMDAEESGVKNIYDDYLASDYRFEKNKDKSPGLRNEMYVVCNRKNKKLFQVTIDYNEQGMLRFSYNSMNNYWGGVYSTNDPQEIRRSIRRLVDDERSEQ